MDYIVNGHEMNANFQIQVYCTMRNDKFYLMMLGFVTVHPLLNIT